MDYSFRHLDPTTTTIYQSTVLYGFESSMVCYMLKVKKGYVVETPFRTVDKWMRGQHIDVLKRYFQKIIPLRIISQAY